MSGRTMICLVSLNIFSVIPTRALISGSFEHNVVGSRGYSEAGSTVMKFDIEPQGDQCVVIRLGGEDVSILNAKVHAITRLINKERVAGVVEVVPAYVSLGVFYDSEAAAFDDLCASLRSAIVEPKQLEPVAARVFDIPVCYDEPYGPDLASVAESHALTADEVILMHTSALYTVAMIGFTPGFPYLLGLPALLSTPRREQPRQLVAAGSVGIGGRQTGIYSLDSPGGWNIIGRTPLRLFRPSDDEPSLLKAGDAVRFVEISEPLYRTMNEHTREN